MLESVSNACTEMAQPILAFRQGDLGEDLRTELEKSLAGLCVLGLTDTMMEYAGLSHIQQTQVHSRVRILTGVDAKLLNSTYSGSFPHERMAELDAEDLALRLIAECEENYTELDNTLDVIRVNHFEESARMISSYAFNQSMKDKGLMQATQHVLSKFPENGFKRDELSVISAKAAPTEQTKDLIDLLAQAGDRGIANPKLKSLDEPRVIKRKKSKPKSKHLPNMKNQSVRRLMGATILSKLGKVQQDTSDAYKRALLKEVPMADLVEQTQGKPLAPYQANLLNSWQAKADPEAPIVKRMRGETEGITTVDEANYQADDVS